MKRGELSMEVIIIAAIALLVLVILSVLILRAGGNVSEACRNVGGECRSGDSCNDGEVSPGVSCGDNSVCCVKGLGLNDE